MAVVPEDVVLSPERAVVCVVEDVRVVAALVVVAVVHEPVSKGFSGTVTAGAVYSGSVYSPESASVLSVSADEGRVISPDG